MGGSYQIADPLWWARLFGEGADFTAPEAGPFPDRAFYEMDTARIPWAVALRKLLALPDDELRVAVPLLLLAYGGHAEEWLTPDAIARRCDRPVEAVEEALLAINRKGLARMRMSPLGAPQFRLWRADPPPRVEAPAPRTPATRRGALVNRRLARCIAAFDATCAYCKRKGDALRDPDGRSWTRDHVIPRSTGGAGQPNNIVLACWRCNAAKCDKPVGEFVEALVREARARAGAS